MTHQPSRHYLAACIIAGLAVLLAAYTGNGWASIVPGILFIFVFFPKWRGKVYRLADKITRKIGGRNACDPD